MVPGSPLNGGLYRVPIDGGAFSVIVEDGHSGIKFPRLSESDEWVAYQSGTDFDGLNPGALRPASGRLHQGHVESSAVDPIKALMAMTAAAKAVTANGKMMQFHDQIMGLAVNTLGRVT